MTLPEAFKEGPAPAIVSYDFNDVADGSGVQTYYPYVDEDSTGTNYKLCTETGFYSRKIETEMTTIDITYESSFDQDFDFRPFNDTRVLKGNATFQCGIRLTSDNAGKTSFAYMKFTVYHYDGTTETSLGTVQSNELSQVGVGDTYEIVNCSCTLTQKTFAPGDQLRVRVEVWTKHTGGATTVTIGHDPQNRDGDNITPKTEDIISRMECYIPSKIFTEP